MSMNVVAVMPAFNEGPRISQAVVGVSGHVFKVIVVDDGSHDHTADEAKKAGALVLRHIINRGQGAALKTGTLAALRMGADVVVHVDADGQHDPSFLPALVAPIINNQSDIVFGSRFLGVESEGMPFARRLLLRFGRVVFNSYFLGLPRQMTDPQCGLRAFHVRAAPALDFTQDRFAHASEILRLASRSSFRWMEVPVRVTYTRETIAKSGHKAVTAAEIAWQTILANFRR